MNQKLSQLCGKLEAKLEEAARNDGVHEISESLLDGQIALLRSRLEGEEAPFRNKLGSMIAPDCHDSEVPYLCSRLDRPWVLPRRGKLSILTCSTCLCVCVCVSVYLCLCLCLCVCVCADALEWADRSERKLKEAIEANHGMAERLDELTLALQE